MNSRRTFLKKATLGLCGVALGSVGRGPLLGGMAQAATITPGATYRLTMTEAIIEMVDLTPVYGWTFADQGGPRFPGPVLFVIEGDSIVLGVQNRLPQNHSFSIPGVADSGIIRPGLDRLVKFKAPPAGTYMYYDPLNEPLNRMMGLHGVLVSLPKPSTVTSPNKITPYSSNLALPASQRTTPAVQQLFNDLGSHDAFANDVPGTVPGTRVRVHGHDWVCDTSTVSSTIWVFFQVDPLVNERVRTGEITTGAQYAQAFTPRYFTNNGRSGWWASQAADTSLESAVGYPRLIRNVNPGLWAHSPHVHCNHGYQTCVDGAVQDNVILLDTWTIRPMQRVDILWPFIKPPDIPQATWDRIARADWNDPATYTEEMALLMQLYPPDRHFGYPMHCHQEVSQSAGGGNYPHGLMAHIALTGEHPHT